MVMNVNGTHMSQVFPFRYDSDGRKECCYNFVEVNGVCEGKFHVHRLLMLNKTNLFRLICVNLRHLCDSMSPWLFWSELYNDMFWSLLRTYLRFDL